jgi:hypothetical protein
MIIRSHCSGNYVEERILMPLTKCIRCEKLFNKTTNAICPQCVPDEELDVNTIITCMDQNPDVNAEMVSEMTGVDIKCVLRMIDSGSITNVSISGSDVKCGQCGAPAISASKKLCQSCLEKLNQKMLQARKAIQIDSKKKVQVGEHSSVRQSLDKKRR